MSDAPAVPVPPHQAGHDLPSVCLSVLSFPRWVSHLISAKTKYALANQSVPDREEGNGPLPGWEVRLVPLQAMGTLRGATGRGSRCSSHAWCYGSCMGVQRVLSMIWGKREKWSLRGGLG